MHGRKLKSVASWAAATLFLSANTTFGQWYGSAADVCNPCGQPVAMAAAPVAVAMAPVQMAAANPCPCLQPVQETVYREVPVTEYRTVQKAARRPVYRTVWEDQKVTAYRTEYETRVAEVPTTSYQQVTECRPQTINRSYMQTTYQQVPKMSPCQYDQRPGFLGWWNRTTYSMRSMFTPNTIASRQIVPNYQMVNVPVTKMVAVPSTRQVSYNVAKAVPYETTQKVARVVLDYEDTTVTALEPYTVKKTVAVGTMTRMAYVNPGGTVTALAPTPDSRSATRTESNRTAEREDDGDTIKAKKNSFQRSVPSAEKPPREDGDGPVAVKPNNKARMAVAKSAGWKAHKTKPGAKDLNTDSNRSFAATPIKKSAADDR